jgi:hypothetical protein
MLDIAVKPAFERLFAAIAGNYERGQARLQSLQAAYDLYMRPILLAAADAQDRLWDLNERAKSKKPVLLLSAEDQPRDPWFPMTKRHYLCSSTYVIARYFAWVESFKEQVSFVDSPEGKESTAKLLCAIKKVERCFAETEIQRESQYDVRKDRQIFQFQQVYIGQKLLNESSRCQSYASFYDNWDTLGVLEDFGALADLLIRSQIPADPQDYDFCRERLVGVNNALVDLVVLLDREAVYVNQRHRIELR